MIICLAFGIRFENKQTTMGKLNTVQNGKGSGNRSNLAKFEAGYDHIDWRRGGPVTASGEDVKPMICGGSRFSKEFLDRCTARLSEDFKGIITVIGEGKTANGKHYIQMTKDGATYTAVDGCENVYVDIAQISGPLFFANMVIDNNGKMIPAPWSVCNLPPEEFNKCKDYTITTSNYVRPSE